MRRPRHERDMSENQIVNSSFAASHAPIDKVDILARCFSLPDFRTPPDDKRMSINVEFAAEFGFEVRGGKRLDAAPP